jgi:hypothetical protein
MSEPTIRARLVGCGGSGYGLVDSARQARGPGNADRAAGNGGSLATIASGAAKAPYTPNGIVHTRPPRAS